jgi:hypothetical protein
MVKIYQIYSLNLQISCKQHGVTCQKNYCLHIHVAWHGWYNCLSGKTIARPQLRQVRSHPSTYEWRQSAAVTSRVLAVRHKTHDKGPFKKRSLRGRRSLLQESLIYEYPVRNWQRKWQSSGLFPRIHVQGDKTSFHSDKWEFEAVLHVRTLSGIWRSDGSRQLSDFLPFRYVP